MQALGPREYRGPLWETTGALAFLLAGVDLFIMVHPGAARTMEDIVGWLADGRNPPTFPDFIGVGHRRDRDDKEKTGPDEPLPASSADQLW